jgi:hypothetical protein
MCNVGDIILIDKYVHNGHEISKHTFVVMDVDNGEIQGLDYDIIGNVMSSFKDEGQKKKKLSFPGNFPILHSEQNVQNSNKKDGYIKAEQLYYFKSDKINYKVIGYISIDAYKRLVDFITNLSIDFEQIVDNLS